MKHYFTLLMLAVSAFCCSACMSTGTQEKQQEKTKTVYSYEGGRIELLDNGKASVNGVSGLWSYCDDKNVAVSLNNIKPYYYVNYGNNQIAVISVKNWMLFFGTENEASEYASRPSKWKEYRKTRE